MKLLAYALNYSGMAAIGLLICLLLHRFLTEFSLNAIIKNQLISDSERKQTAHEKVWNCGRMKSIRGKFLFLFFIHIQ